MLVSSLLLKVLPLRRFGAQFLLPVFLALPSLPLDNFWQVLEQALSLHSMLAQTVKSSPLTLPVRVA
jgi:hypothetical protein